MEPETRAGEGQATPEGLANAVQCSFCKLWFSRNSYTLHYLEHPTPIIPGVVCVRVWVGGCARVGGCGCGGVFLCVFAVCACRVCVC